MPASRKINFKIRRRAISIAIQVVTVIAICTSVAAASKARTVRCPHTNVHVVAANHYVEIYENLTSSQIMGCAYSQGHQYALGPIPAYSPDSGGHGLFEIKLAGNMVAYEYNTEYKTAATMGSNESYVVVRDLATGKTIRHVPTGMANKLNPPSNEIGTGSVYGLVVKSDGAVAWIAPAGSELAPSGELLIHQVEVFDKSGYRVLATSASIDTHSLALASSRIYWTENGKPVSALLN